MSCEHKDFKAQVDVNRITISEGESECPYRFMAHIRIECAECGVSFSFIGLPGGLRFAEPRVGPFGLEARMPIEPCKIHEKDDLN